MQPHGMLNGKCVHGNNNFCTCCDMESHPERYIWYPIFSNKIDKEIIYVLVENEGVFRGRYALHGQDIVFDRVLIGRMMKFSRGEKNENT